MNTIHPIIKQANDAIRQDVVRLLQTEKLPVDDLPASLENFFVARDENTVIGNIGLELYGSCGLLRSLVVDRAYRNQHIASLLIEQLEQYALTKGVHCMYLLTETAPQYFERKGYQKITRTEVPEVLKASSEFGHVCPVSAIVMQKKIQ